LGINCLDGLEILVMQDNPYSSNEFGISCITILLPKLACSERLKAMFYKMRNLIYGVCDERYFGTHPLQLEPLEALKSFW